MKKIFSLALILALALSVPAFSSVPLSGPYDGGSRIALVTGGEQGEYHAFGRAIAEAVSRATSTQIRAVASGGSMQNIDALAKGTAQLAFIQTDSGFYASTGKRLFNQRYRNFSTVAVLYPEPVQIVTLNPEITHVENLRGKTVSIGPEGSGTFFNALDVLEAYEMTLDDINPVLGSFGDSVEALKEGKIDAAFIVAGTPTPAVTELAKAGKVYLVSFDDKHIIDLIAKCQYYGKCDLPKSTYGTDDDDMTVAVHSVIVARDDVKMEDVYNFMYGVLEGENKFSKPLTLRTAASYIAVPYHPGAVKYLGEKGILVSGKK